MSFNSVKDLITFFGSDLWLSMQELFVMCLIISIVSILFVEAVKITDENVFTKVKANSVFMWVLNLIFISILTVLFVFDKKKKNGILFTILYIIILIFFSWSLSMLLYTYAIKYLLLFLEIGKNKLEKWKDESETIKLKSEELLNEVKKEINFRKVNKEIKKEQ